MQEKSDTPGCGPSGLALRPKRDRIRAVLGCPCGGLPRGMEPKWMFWHTSSGFTLGCLAMIGIPVAVVLASLALGLPGWAGALATVAAGFPALHGITRMDRRRAREEEHR